MRQLRDRASRYRGRAAFRVRYAAYIDSRAWWERRRRWVDEHRRRTGEEPVCVVCGRTWRERRDDMHHRSYERLGTEAHDDLVPMCRPCHAVLHEVLDRHWRWRHMPRPAATDQLIGLLRRHSRP